MSPPGHPKGEYRSAQREGTPTSPPGRLYVIPNTLGLVPPASVLPDETLAARRAEGLAYLDAFELVSVDRSVLLRAAEPFPTALGTLDAIHLSSALLVRDQIPDLVVATHDRELATAAHSVGFRVAGVSGLA